MPEQITVSGAAAGTSGSAYRRILTYPGKASGNYVFNETNFPGLGQYLPCLALIVATVSSGTLAMSTDNGTTWLPLLSGTTNFGATLYLDTASTLRIVLFATGDVRVYVR
jgi:hypothetical protein